MGKKEEKEIISKLGIIVYDIEKLKKEYEEERLKFIKNKQDFIPGGFFQSDHYVKNPKSGEAEWNSKYPKGFESWANYNGDKLTSFGIQKIINKIDEIVEVLNKLTK